MTAPRPSLEAHLNDPAVGDPLKPVLPTWGRRDSLDAARDAATLGAVMEGRAILRLDPRHGP